VFGASPRPRGLFLGLPPDELNAATRFFATSEAVDAVTAVRQAEWDAIVSRQEQISSDTEPHLYVLGLGSTYLGQSTDTQWDHYAGSQVMRRGSSLARELELPLGLPVEIERAVVADLLPKARARQQHATIIVAQRHSKIGQPSDLVPFLATTAGDVIAGRFTRRGGHAECWVLPEYADAALWTEIAVGRWRSQDPSRFPRPWSDDAEWLTVAEQKAAQELREIDIDRQRLEEELAERTRLARAALEEASREADTKERRLLTSQGDALVVAVSSALSRLDFKVRDMDAELPAGDRREDLRVRSPDDASWEAIVEIRGYGGGAQLGDLTRLDRFANRYEIDEGRPPSSCWYVCNQLIGRHPSERQSMLASNPAEVQIFREERPLALIDTAQLFKLLTCVQLGALPTPAARELLEQLNDVLVTGC